jgi:hypothetical protein
MSMFRFGSLSLFPAGLLSCFPLPVSSRSDTPVTPDVILLDSIPACQHISHHHVVGVGPVYFISSDLFIYIPI